MALKVKNRDMLVNTMAAMIAGAIAYIGIAGRFSFLFGGGRRKGGLLALLALFLAPLAAVMIRLAVSRNREHGADRGGAEISGKPGALAQGLEHIQTIVNRKEAVGTETKLDKKGNPTTSHLFIINPFRKGNIAELFSTHPSTEERVKRLKEMENSANF